MSEKELRDALLMHNGGAHAGPLDAELAALQRLVDAERHRMRRLTIWVIIVWGIWLLMIIAGLGAPMLAKAHNGTLPAATQPAGQRAPQQPAPDHARARPEISLFGVLLGAFLFALFLVLPVSGIVLAIMMILGRRTASTNRIRASVAALEAKLRLLELHKPAGGA